MTKALINIDNLNPEEGDIIAFHKGKWVSLTHGEAFSCENRKIYELNNNVNDLKARIKQLEDYIKQIAIAVKEK